jgi:hypothetical protein
LLARIATNLIAIQQDRRVRSYSDAELLTMLGQEVHDEAVVFPDHETKQ